MASPSWEDYVYPGTNVLRNLFDIRHAGVLSEAERYASAARQVEIDEGQAQIPRTYDLPHLQALHRHLFQDIYPWAGELRTVGMRKEDREFAHQGQIKTFMQYAVGIAAEGPVWAELSAGEVEGWAGHLYAWANHAHPFREGNGRSAKLWVSQIVEQSQHRIDWAAIDKPSWDLASRQSAPAPGDWRPRGQPLAELFHRSGAVIPAAKATDQTPQRRLVDRVREILNQPQQHQPTPVPAEQVDQAPSLALSAYVNEPHDPTAHRYQGPNQR